MEGDMITSGRKNVDNVDKLNFICESSELVYLLLVEVCEFLMVIAHNEEGGEKGK